MRRSGTTAESIGWNVIDVRRGWAFRSVICSVAAFSAAVSMGLAADAPARSAQSDDSENSIVIDSASTQFVMRRRLSADRVGVLGMAPEEGDFIVANTIVAKLRDEVPVAAVAAAAAKAESDAEINAAAKLADSERLEFQLMADANAKSSNRPYPRSDVDRAQLKAEAADLQTGVKRQEKRLFELQKAQAEAELKTYHIVSPIDGMVIRVFKHAGEGVQQAEPILEVVNTSTIRVEGRVPAAKAGRLRAGLPVRVEFKLGPEPTSGPPAPKMEQTGRLGFVDVTAEGVGTQRAVRVWAELPNPRQILRDGTPAKMTIQLDAGAGDVLEVPPAPKPGK